MALRHRIREVAESKGISRTKLSQRSETHYRTINELWNDPHKPINTQVLERIAKALQVPAKDLLVEEPDKEDKE